MAILICRCGAYAPIQLTRSLRLVWDAERLKGVDIMEQPK